MPQKNEAVSAVSEPIMGKTKREAEGRREVVAEASVWTKRMLASLVSRVKRGKWYSLMDKVYAPSTLEAAWQVVRANQGAARPHQR